MKVVTLRNLPSDLIRIIQRKADERRSSISKTVISMLEESTGLSPRRKEKRSHHDLDHLSGSWTKEEGAAFARALTAQRTIDADLWK